MQGSFKILDYGQGFVSASLSYDREGSKMINSGNDVLGWNIIIQTRCFMGGIFVLSPTSIKSIFFFLGAQVESHVEKVGKFFSCLPNVSKPSEIDHRGL